MLEYYRFKEALDCCMQGDADKAREILAELQQKYIEVCDENAMLRSQVAEYEDILYLAKNLEYDGRCYWLFTGSIRQGPFCRKCYDEHGLLTRLHEEGGDQWQCLSCGCRFEKGDVVAGAVISDGASHASAKGGSHGAVSKIIPLYK